MLLGALLTGKTLISGILVFLALSVCICADPDKIGPTSRDAAKPDPVTPTKIGAKPWQQGSTSTTRLIPAPAAISKPVIYK